MSRQCGSRVAGGMYACVPVGPDGSPLEEFLVCPPVRVDAAALGLSPVGVKVIGKQVDGTEPCRHCAGTGKVPSAEFLRADSLAALAGDRAVMEAEDEALCSYCAGTGKHTIHHVFDIVGAEFYPNVSDFIEETRHMGVSRRCELQTEQARLLTPDSRLVLLHPKALLENADAYLAVMRDAGQLSSESELAFFHCPKYLTRHGAHNPSFGGESCLGLCYHDLEHNTVEQVVYAEKPRYAHRVLECGKEYDGYTRAPSIEPAHALAIFAVFPLHHFELVDPEGQHADKLDRFAECALTVDVCEE